MRIAGRALPTLRRRGLWALVACCAVALVVTLAFAFIGGSGHVPGNVSQYYRACLISSPQDARGAGLTDAVRQALTQDAREGQINAQVFDTPTTDAGAAQPYIGGAVQERCDAILTVGTRMTAAAEKAARAHPHAKFVLVGAADGSDTPNVLRVRASTPDGIRAAVASLVRRLSH